jgi:hypothetical protein
VAAAGSARGAFAIVFFLVFFGYDVLFEVRSRGRTPGKRWTGLRVVRTGGRPITFVPSCVRNVMRIVDILPAFYAIGMFSIFVTERNQRLGDLAAGTLVVRERPGGIRERPRRRGARRARAHAGWDVSAVSAQDVGTVRQFLDRRGGLERGPRAELAASSSGGCARSWPARRSGWPPRSSSSGSPPPRRIAARWKARLTSGDVKLTFHLPRMNNRVKELRNERGLSQQQLGEAMDVSRQTINSIEKERYTPSCRWRSRSPGTSAPK